MIKIKNQYWWFIGIFVILGGGAKVGLDYVKQRGIRNNNPGNIKRTKDKWQGLSETQNDDTFFQFDNPVWGLRAAAKLLRNYQTLRGLQTISDIISRWSPPVENNTQNYINFVSKKVGISANSYINLGDNVLLTKLLKAVVQYENGVMPYSDAQIEQAINLVGY